MKLESKSSFDNFLPSQNDDDGIIGAAAEDDDDASGSRRELMEVYDSCRKLNQDEDGNSSRRPSLASSSGSGSGDNNNNNNIKHRLDVSEDEHAYPCKDTYSFVPPSPPEKWPQRPILLRPSPESGMRIRGVRLSSKKAYLPLPGTGYCNGCTLPINNGLEKPGECLVIDFESDLFIGTAMLRIKNVCAPLKKTKSDKINHDQTAVDSSYFDNRKRTFQGIVRGRFKTSGIPMSECVTGQVFNRPAGHLPPRIIMKGAISIFSHLAPQLQARLDGDCPRFLSPLVSTAQSAMSCKQAEEANVDNSMGSAGESIEAALSEPQPSDSTSLVQELLHSGVIAKIPHDSNCITTRIKNRKRAFDKLHASRSKKPTFDPSSEYTFEFFQHLLLFDEFALNFVKPIGKHPLHGMLNGQPLKFMAAHQIQERDEKSKVIGEEMRWLWSFDLWHESLIHDEEH